MNAPISRLKYAPALSLLLLLPHVALADGLRCGSRLMLVGDSEADLASLCGKPAQVDKSLRSLDGTNVDPGEKPSPDDRVAIETWIYNFGSDQLMQRVRIEAGKITAIESMRYGH